VRLLTGRYITKNIAQKEMTHGRIRYCLAMAYAWTGYISFKYAVLLSKVSLCYLFHILKFVHHRVPRDEQSIQIPYVAMLQPILGERYWYYIWNQPKFKSTMRDPIGSRICALPVRGCNLVFRLDRISSQLRVQFRIKKGSYDSLVNDLPRTEEFSLSERERLLGKWMKDEINDIETWLLIVAVEINTENVAPTKMRRSSKKQEIFDAKVRTLSLYFFSFIFV